MTMRREKATVYDEPPEKWVGQNYMNHNLKIIKDNKWSVTSLTLKMNAVYVFSLLQWMRKQIWLTPPARQNRRELVIWNHLEVSPFLNLLEGTRAATNLVLTQVIISESGNPFGLGHKRLTCRILYFDSFVFVIMIILTFHKGKAYSKPIQRRQYVVFCNLKTICCYHAIWATMESCFSSLAKNYPKNANKKL